MQKLNKSFVWAKLPKAGLGNKLIVWAEAYLFASKYNLKLVTTHWFSFFPGTFLRREKNKRLYWGEVKQLLFKTWLHLFTHCFYRKQIIDVDKYNTIQYNTIQYNTIQYNTIFLFLTDCRIIPFFLTISAKI